MSVDWFVPVSWIFFTRNVSCLLSTSDLMSELRKPLRWKVLSYLEARSENWFRVLLDNSCRLIRGNISQNRLRIQTQRQGHRQGMICQKPPARHILMAWTCCHLGPVIHVQLQNATNCVHINHQIEGEGGETACMFRFKLLNFVSANKGEYTTTTWSSSQSAAGRHKHNPWSI